MKRLVIVGGYTVDHIVRVDHGVRFSQPGGPGVYAALAAALVAGVRVSLVCGLPRAGGDAVRALLAGGGVDLSLCHDVDDAPRLWILDAPEGRRIVPTAVRAGEPERTDADRGRDAARPVPAQVLDTRLDAAEAVLVSNPTVAELAVIPRAPVVGLDPEQLELRAHGWAYVEACAAVAGVLFPSRLQLRQLGDDPLQVAREMHRRLGLVVVAKLDREGAVVCDRDGGVWRIVDHAVRVVDTTGAGDALAGATVAALASGADLRTAAAIGVSAARLALSDWGPAGLRSHPPGALRWPLSSIEVSRLSSPASKGES